MFSFCSFEDADDACSATTEWLDEHSCPNGHLGGQYGCDFCNVGVGDKSGTNNLNEFLKEQGWEKYDIKKHYNLKYKVKVEKELEPQWEAMDGTIKMTRCLTCNMAWVADGEVGCKCPESKFDYKSLMKNPEPWEEAVANIGKDKAEAVEERSKHVKIVVDEKVINLFVKPLEGQTFQIKAYSRSDVKNLMDDIDAYLHENLQTCGDVGDAYIKKHDELLADNRLKIQYHGKTLEDDTMYDFKHDDTISIISVLSGEGSIRFVLFHFQ